MKKYTTIQIDNETHKLVRLISAIEKKHIHQVLNNIIKKYWIKENFKEKVTV